MAKIDIDLDDDFMEKKPEKPPPNLADVLLNRNVLDQLTLGTPTFDRAGLLTALFSALSQKMGKDGQTALAEVMVQEFFASKPGSSSRTRILDTWSRLLNWHSDDVKEIPVEDMTEEELISTITSSLPRLRLVADMPPRKRRDQAPAKPRAKDRMTAVCLTAGSQMKALRVKLGMSQVELALKAGMKEKSGVAIISYFERGYRWPTERDLPNLAEALGVKLGRVREGEFAAGTYAAARRPVS